MMMKIVNEHWSLITVIHVDEYVGSKPVQTANTEAVSDCGGSLRNNLQLPSVITGVLFLYICNLSVIA